MPWKTDIDLGVPSRKSAVMAVKVGWGKIGVLRRRGKGKGKKGKGERGKGKMGKREKGEILSHFRCTSSSSWSHNIRLKCLISIDGLTFSYFGENTLLFLRKSPLRAVFYYNATSRQI